MEKTTFSTTDARANGYRGWKKYQPNLAHYTSINSQQIIGLNVKCKTINFLVVKKSPTKIVRVNIFQPLEINQRFAAIWGEFIRKRWLNLDKTRKLCGILFCHILILPSQIHGFESQHSTSPVKTSSLAATWGEQKKVGALSLSHPRGLSLFEMSSGFLEDPTPKAILTWPDSELRQCK